MYGACEDTNMKILYLTHGTINFEEKKNFYDTLIEMKHEVVYYNYNAVNAVLGHEEMQRDIILCVDTEKPDLIFFLPNKDQVRFETLESIRRLKVPILSWFCDDAWRFDDYTTNWLSYLDYAVTTDPYSIIKYMGNGFDNVILLNWGANPEHYIHLECEKIYDVSFVGQAHGDRKEIIQKLKDANIKVHAFGKGFTDRVEFDEMIKIFNQSKINLNFASCSSGGRTQAKARDFEIACTGNFLLTQRNELLDDYFNTNEIAQWDDVDHLIGYIKFWLKQGELREIMAKKARERVLKEHTYQHRFEKIFNLIKGEK